MAGAPLMLSFSFQAGQRWILKEIYTSPTPETAAKLGAINGSGLALAADAAGSLYIADSYNNRVRKETPVNGFIDTIAGGSDRGDSGDGGPAKAALLFGAS